MIILIYKKKVYQNDPALHLSRYRAVPVEDTLQHLEQICYHHICYIISPKRPGMVSVNP